MCFSIKIKHLQHYFVRVWGQLNMRSYLLGKV